MAEWNWHIALAREVSKLGNIVNEPDFILGSILPDTPWTSVVEGTASGFRHKMHCSRIMDHSMNMVADVSRFLDNCLPLMQKNELFCGWLTHLVLDETLCDHWNLMMQADGVSTYWLKDGVDLVRRTVDEISNIKWTDMHNYASTAFGDQSQYFPSTALCLSEDCVDCLTQIVGLTNAQVGAIFDRTPSTIKSMLGNKTDRFFISKNYYDAIHSECVAKCSRILSVICS